MKKEFLDSVFGKQRATKDTHDFHDGPIEFEVMLDDSHEAVCDDGNMYLNSHSVLRFTPKGLDSEMLFNPFEKEFNLPPVSVQKCDILGWEVKIVGIISKGSLQFGSIIDDSPNFCRVVVPIVLSCKANCLVPYDVILSFKEVLTGDDFISRMTLFSYDKECAGLFNFEKS